MHIYGIIRFQKMVLESFVVIWLLMGGLALAEQLDVVSETGPHDEQALGHLQLAVKSEALDDSTGPIPPDLLQLSVAVRPVTIVTPLFGDLTCPLLRSKNIRSLLLLTSCYRI